MKGWGGGEGAESGGEYERKGLKEGTVHLAGGGEV